MAESIKIEGLNEFVKGLKQIDTDLPKTLRIAFNEAAQVIVDDARPHVPKRSGRAAGSIKVSSLRNKVRVREGSGRASYMPWLDFGGRTGKNKSVVRPFYKEGRYIWKSFSQKRPQLIEAISKALADAARRAGIEVE